MRTNIIYISLFSLVVLFTTSCKSSRQSQTNLPSTRELTNKMGMPVNNKDNLRLYSEAADWLGTPYRYGGTNRRGVDCSGMVCQIYKEVYRKNLSRSTADILKKDCKKVRKGSLKEGDLVFFNTTGKKKKTPTHVGIYLKDGKFIHSSTSRGVIINNLSEPYYARNWITGGRVR